MGSIRRLLSFALGAAVLNGPFILRSSLAAAPSVPAVAAGFTSERDLASPERKPTRTVLSVTPTPSADGQQVTLTATVSGPSQGDRAAGAVEFYSGPILLGVLPLPVEGTSAASLQVADLAAGMHTLTARYMGHPDFFPSASPPVHHTVKPR